MEDATVDTSQTASRPALAMHVGATIMCHPDLARVGQSARLFDFGAAGTAKISRIEPIFRDQQGSQTSALATARVSRSPLAVSMLIDGSVRITAERAAHVYSEERLIEGCVAFSTEHLANGILLRIGNYVLLRIGLFPNRVERQQVPKLIGQGAAMQRLRQDILRVADLPVPVMLRGETGVGKELVASALHDLSPRQQGPYVCVNMAAIPPSMATAELFGHERGAFTGAGAARTGYFAEANRGTLFLDEMGETAADVQPVLLRAIESGVIQPLGGKLRTVDVRIVAATDSNLETAAEQGRFSGALLRRFEYDMWIPPLRERIEDVPELFAHFLAEAFASFGDAPSPQDAASATPLVEARFVMRLMRHAWPGNVRELRAVARRVAISTRGNERAAIDERLLTVLGPEHVSSEPSASAAAPKRRAAELGDEEILIALRRNGFSINATAVDLAVSRSWLHARMNDMPKVRKARDLDIAEMREAMARSGGKLEDAAALLEVSARGLQLQLSRLEGLSEDGSS